MKRLPGHYQWLVWIIKLRTTTIMRELSRRLNTWEIRMARAGRVRLIRREDVRVEVASWIAANPVEDPVDAWVDRLLDVIDGATCATQEKGRPLWDVLADWDKP